MKRIAFLCLASFIATGLLWAQGVTQGGTPTGEPKFPLLFYRELPDPDAPSEEAWASVKDVKLSWGNTDTRYAKHKVPFRKEQSTVAVEGWRGERVNAQAVIWTGVEVDHLTLSLTEFKNEKGDVWPAGTIQAAFVRYVLTDELNKDKKGACGHRDDHSKYDSLLVADVIDPSSTFMILPARSTQPVWVECRIPRMATPGVHKGELLVKDGERVIKRLKMEVKALDRELPPPSEWAYHLDLWQNPFAVARYHQVPLWSDAHFEAMRPVMKMLDNAGQKIITTSIMHKPWNGQTEDYFETMVTWMKRADGTWVYDYTVFDRWVEFMMNIGIKEQINCYSMIPWELSFQYFDQATNSLKVIKAAPGSKEYEELWLPMLTSFAKHLREKGWFDICTIAMDERPMDAMLKTLKVIKKADKDFKVTLAGNYHKELEPEIYDYCIAIGQEYPKEVIESRAAAKKPTTYYTCCAEAFPNTFTFSDPAEAAWMSYYCAQKHLDGYLRWAYNSWPLEPLLDSRFRSWAGGDTYLVYPGGRSSIRFEKMIEGIQAHEKITILRKEYERTGNKAGLNKIEKMLSTFGLYDFPEVAAAATVNKANRILNALK